MAKHEEKKEETKPTTHTQHASHAKGDTGEESKAKAPAAAPKADAPTGEGDHGGDTDTNPVVPANSPAPDEKHQMRRALENAGNTTTGTDQQAAIAIVRGENPSLQQSAEAAIEAQKKQQEANEAANKAVADAVAKG